MLKREHRLVDAQDFQKLRQVGRTYRHALLVISVAPNQLPLNRYGFVVSKPFGNAVKRNRARRLMREAARNLHTHTQPGYDIVCIARRSLAEASYAELFVVIRELFRKAGLVTEK
jgi:ribonuclease P protein component